MHAVGINNLQNLCVVQAVVQSSDTVLCVVIMKQMHVAGVNRLQNFSLCCSGCSAEF